MEAFLIYSCKLAVFLIVLYICLRAFLSRETFYSFNRWVLLGGVGLCLLLPFVKVTVSESMAAHIPALMLENLFANETPEEVVVYDEPYNLYSENIEISETTDPVTYTDENSVNINLSIGQILMIIYIVGLLVNLVLLARSAYQMMKLIRSNPSQDYQGYKLVLTSKNVVPFSWRRYIVISKVDFKNNPDEILTHEIAHIKHRHSLDIIVMECVLLLQWFNPAAWLLKRELKDIHEFQADMTVLESGIDTTKYQLLLVKKAVGASSYTLANSFNHSKIKKRITMMLKEKSSKWARLKLLLLLPLGALSVFAFARPEVNEPVSASADYESTINSGENEILQSQVQKNNSEKGIVVHVNIEDETNVLYYPIAYDEAKEGEKAILDNFVKYAVGNKEYTRKGFEELVQGEMYFKTKANIKSKDTVILEFYCVTQKGLKTPTLYMVKIEDKIFLPPAYTKEWEPIYIYDITIRDRADKPQSTVKFNPPPITKKDDPLKKVVLYSPAGDGEPLFILPSAYDEAKEGEKPILDAFVKYVTGGKEYTREEFEKLATGKKFVRNKADVGSGETGVIEFYCISKKGQKTPVWYLVKMDGNKSKRTVKFVPPVIKKDKPQDGGKKQGKSDEKEIKTKLAKGGYPSDYGEDVDKIKIVKYIVKGKEYTASEFEKLVVGHKFEIDKTKINFDKADVIEFYGINESGKKTPTWYMVKINDDSKPKSTVRFVPPVIKKDGSKEKSKTSSKSKFNPPPITKKEGSKS